MIARLGELSQDQDAQLPLDLRKLLVTLVDHWQSSSDPQRRELLRQTVRRVEYDGTGGTISVSLRRAPPDGVTVNASEHATP